MSPTALAPWQAFPGAQPGTKVVLLGTSGGPAPVPGRSGIAQAVVVNGQAYVVDCGNGVAQQLVRAGYPLPRLRNVFVTHLHSDHVADYFNLFFLGWRWIQEGVKRRGFPIGAWGPGPAGGIAALPPDREGAAPFAVTALDNPTPGLIDLTRAQFEAHAYDINIRVRDSGHLELATLFEPHEIGVPAAIGAHGPDRVAPPMEPVVVMEDESVTVTAILVEHPPVFPSFAFRFDTDAGSVVISGDTAPSPNLVKLARGADVLVHEVMDPDFFEELAMGNPAIREQEGWEEQTRHIRASHTGRHDVGKVAAAAGVGRLVLTHFIPSANVADERWASAAAAHFDGEIVVGHDLLQLEL